jgi:hypothetical protein
MAFQNPVVYLFPRLEWQIALPWGAFSFIWITHALFDFEIRGSRCKMGKLWRGF